MNVVSFLIVHWCHVLITCVCFNVEFTSVLTVFLWLDSEMIRYFLTIISTKCSTKHLCSISMLLPFWKNIVTTHWYLILRKNRLRFIHGPFRINIRQYSSFFTWYLLKILSLLINIFNSLLLSNCLIWCLHWCSFVVDIIYHHAEILVDNGSSILLYITITCQLWLIPYNNIFSESRWACCIFSVYFLRSCLCGLIFLLDPVISFMIDIKSIITQLILVHNLIREQNVMFFLQSTSCTMCSSFY